MTQYQGDALWGPCPDGGTIEFATGTGTVVRSGGLAGAVYISMTGGNHKDSGDPESREQWWGNHLEANPDHHVRGRTGTLLAGLPLSGANLNRIVEVVKQDLAWMLSTGVATGVEVAVAIEAARRVVITVEVTTDNTSETFIFRENWVAGPSEPNLVCAC